MLSESTMLTSNNSTENLTLFAKTPTVFGEDLRNRTVLASCFMFSAGVIGNVLALVMMATSPPEQRRTIFYKLMAGLAFTDLVGTCATSPVVITIYATNLKLDNEMSLCHYFSFMMIFAGFSTMSLVCAMAIERYICLCHPYTYHCKLPKSYAKYSFIASWLISIFIAALPLMGLGHNSVQFPYTWCFFNSTSRAAKDVAFNLIYATIAFIAILATLGCNVATIISVLALKKRQNALSASQDPNIKKYRSLVQRYAELHMVVMLVGVTIVFISCFGPLMVFTILCQTNLTKYMDINQVYLLMIRLASFNPIIDPWVYLLVRRELRWKIICFIKFILRIKSRTALSLPIRDGESPVFFNHKPKLATDMSCLTFCFHCLCDPPNIKLSTISLPRNTSNLNVASPSPSCMKRLASIDSLLNGTSRVNIITQPSPSEELLLKRFSQFKTDEVGYQENLPTTSQHRT